MSEQVWFISLEDEYTVPTVTDSQLASVHSALNTLIARSTPVVFYDREREQRREEARARWRGSQSPTVAQASPESQQFWAKRKY